MQRDKLCYEDSGKWFHDNDREFLECLMVVEIDSVTCNNQRLIYMYYVSVSSKMCLLLF